MLRQISQLFLGYIVMLRARMFRSLIPVLMIKERNIRARNNDITCFYYSTSLIYIEWITHLITNPYKKVKPEVNLQIAA